MSKDKVIALKNPSTPALVSDALTDILRRVHNGCWER